MGKGTGRVEIGRESRLVRTVSYPSSLPPSRFASHSPSRAPQFTFPGDCSLSQLSLSTVSLLASVHSDKLMRILLVFLFIFSIEAKNCKPKASGVKLETFVNNDVNSVLGDPERTTVRRANQLVYFWPSLSDFERSVLRDSFHQIARRTCITFEEQATVKQEWKPWNDPARLDAGQPYVIIRKSRMYAAYTENELDNGVSRTILYISQNAFEQNSYNQSRGAVMDQLVRYMGMRKELLRPDAPSYIESRKPTFQPTVPRFHPAQLAWPFDPESVTVPLDARKTHFLSEYCPARNDADIGAGQRVGLLTKWDAIKLNSMYCPQEVRADPKKGPCVIPRKKDLEIFKYRVEIFNKIHGNDSL